MLLPLKRGRLHQQEEPLLQIKWPKVLHLLLSWDAHQEYYQLIPNLQVCQK